MFVPMLTDSVRIVVYAIIENDKAVCACVLLLNYSYMKECANKQRQKTKKPSSFDHRPPFGSKSNVKGRRWG